MTLARPAIRRGIHVGALLATFLLLTRVFAALTRLLQPWTCDVAALAADGALGHQPSFLLGRLAAKSAALEHLLPLLPWALPIVAAVVLVAELRQPRPRAGLDLGVALVVASVVVGLLCHATPVLGPRAALSAFFPHDEAIAFPPSAALTGERAAVPSLGMVGALLVYWHARPLGRGLGVTAAVLVGVTILAALASGRDFAIDLVISVPVAVAIHAAQATALPWRSSARWLPVVTGAVSFGLWAVLFRRGAALLFAAPQLTLALALVALATALTLERRLSRAVEAAPVKELAPEREPMPRASLVVLAVFFVSGFAGLVYEVMFAKSLALVFGSTATAATTVLATYMGGMSLGSWLGGKLAARTRQPLKLYALCEAGVALSCAVAPFAFGVLRASYVAVAHGMEPGRPSLIALQVALGAMLLLPPTLLMGATLPLLGRQLAVEGSGLGRIVGALYGANTLGAALGALATGYFLLQALGVMHTTMLAVALNLLVALAALRWAERAGPVEATAPSAASEPLPRASTQAKRVGWAVLGVGGMVTLALEGIYTHLLAVVAGNSTFAFSAMLFCFLIGLGLGSALGRGWLRGELSLPLGIGLAQALIAACVLGGVFVWGHIPAYFGSFADYRVNLGFGEREIVRLVVCSIAMIPPALFIGASYPLAMECVGSGPAGDRVKALGRAAAVNTLGNVAGALLGGFVLLPRLGSLHALQVLGCTSLALAFLPLILADARDRAKLVGAGALGVVLVLVQPRSFDLTLLASGANVYFSGQGFGEVIDHAESADGGLTTVESHQFEGGPVVKTLLTNGKFQGNDALTGEVTAQVSFALVPLLHEPRRRSALVIGFGTGMTSRIVSDAGFASVDVAELSADIARLSDRHFATVNEHVLSRPSVHLHVTDGRNYLLLEPRTYDLITLEITSIWFAGAASLYDTDFYRLAKPRLAPGGVLQQWVQLHHLGEEDYVAILSSMRSVFRNVWLYLVGGQGLLIACDDDCAPSMTALSRIDGEPALKEALGLVPGGTTGLLHSRVLTPAGVDAFLAREGVTEENRGDLASTDDNLRLEYSTPRGNARDYNESLTANINMFAAFSPDSELEGTHLGRKVRAR